MKKKKNPHSEFYLILSAFFILQLCEINWITLIFSILTPQAWFGEKYFLLANNAVISCCLCTRAMLPRSRVCSRENQEREFQYFFVCIFLIIQVVIALANALTCPVKV